MLLCGFERFLVLMTEPISIVIFEVCRDTPLKEHTVTFKGRCFLLRSLLRSLNKFKIWCFSDKKLHMTIKQGKRQLFQSRLTLLSHFVFHGGQRRHISSVSWPHALDLSKLNSLYPLKSRNKPPLWPCYRAFVFVGMSCHSLESI